MTKEEKLASVDKKIYDTYHSKKNKEALPIVLFFSAIVLIFNGAILFELIIWGIYYAYCSANNEKLNNNPTNLKNREFLLEYKRKILNDDFKFKY